MACRIVEGNRSSSEDIQSREVTTQLSNLDLNKKQINDFPDEILLRIFRLLPVFQLHSGVMRVCQRWESIARESALWIMDMKKTKLIENNIYLAISKTPYLRSFICTEKIDITTGDLLVRCLANNCPSLRVVLIKTYVIFSKDSIELLTLKCPNITKLHLTTTSAIYVKCLANLKKLTTLYLDFHILTLNQRKYDEISSLFLELMTNCPRLCLFFPSTNVITESSFQIIADHKRDQMVGMKTKMFASTANILSKFKKLELLFVELTFDCESQHVQQLGALENLKTLSISTEGQNFSTTISPIEYDELFSKCRFKNLKILKILNQGLIKSSYIESICKNCTNLEEIHIGTLRFEDEESLFMLVKQLPALRSITLSDLRRPDELMKKVQGDNVYSKKIFFDGCNNYMNCL